VKSGVDFDWGFLNWFEKSMPTPALTCPYGLRPTNTLSVLLTVDGCRSLLRSPVREWIS